MDFKRPFPRFFIVKKESETTVSMNLNRAFRCALRYDEEKKI